MSKFKLLTMLSAAALLSATMFCNVGCASTAADQGTSSGWTDAQAMDLDVNFYASGAPTDAEIVEGDEVPAGRIVRDDSTITINVNIGTDGQAEATRGDAGATNTPTVETDVSGIPGVTGGG